MAAAIGAGLPVHEPAGNMIVDIGGGTTEVAVISLGGIVASESIRIAGDELDEAIIAFVKKEYSLALGERTSEEIKIALGSAYPLEEELYAEIRGRDLVSGLPKTVVVSTEEIREAIEEPVAAIVDAVKVTLDKTPPELAADIMGSGIVHHRRRRAAPRTSTERLHSETGMPILVAENPLYSVAIGSGLVPREPQGAEGRAVVGSRRRLAPLVDGGPGARPAPALHPRADGAHGVHIGHAGPAQPRHGADRCRGASRAPRGPADQRRRRLGLLADPRLVARLAAPRRHRLREPPPAPRAAERVGEGAGARPRARAAAEVSAVLRADVLAQLQDRRRDGHR